MTRKTAKQKRGRKVWVAVINGQPIAYSCREMKREVLEYVRSRFSGIVPDYISIQAATLALLPTQRKRSNA